MSTPNDLASRVTALFSSPKYQPMHERDLAKRLHLPSGRRGELRRVLRDLEAKGLASCTRGGRWGAPLAKINSIEGIFRVRQNGTSWIIPDDPQTPPLKIDASNAGVAMNGDRIQATLIRREGSERRFGTRPEVREARVLRVVERKRSWVVGILQATPYYAYIVPRDALLKTNIKLTDPPHKMEAMLGHLVAARIMEDEPSEGRPVTATFDTDLGDPDSAANDIPGLLIDHGFSETFPAVVQKAANRVPKGLGRHDSHLKGRTDLRNRLIFTIDPSDAHDYDDAVSIEALDGGRWKLGVHIADVAAYVAPHSDIDREALRRGNSTYLVDRVIRMLPEDLTVRVCSLQPNEDHLTHSVDMIFDAKGHLLEAETYRSVIRSAACLSYESVQSFFDTGELASTTPEIRRAINQLRGLSRNIRNLRFRNGALDFYLPEIHCELDEAGNPVGFTKRGSSEAYNLIEECMLAANQVVATKVFEARVPGMYRVHDEPTEEQWARMAGELTALGQEPAPENAKEINHVARSVRGKPEQYIVTLTLLRNMKRAVYEAESRPHFGLGFEHYAHFTSPIRRYPDLILHRILNAIEDKTNPPYTAAEIAKLAIHCSETERESAELETRCMQIKRIRYYALLLENGETGPFAGTVISLNPKGLIVELIDTLQTGMLPYYALGKERYYVADDGYSATCRRGAPYRLGQELDVGLAAVDEHLKRVDFYLPSEGETTPTGPRRGPGRKTTKLRKSVDNRRQNKTDSQSSRSKRPGHKRR
ncbi:MAG: VacB/RNase II family 3'-5' exoribonuclease [Verrucomicrobiota bacterium]|jgi:ribonuclease R|nr:VacB/RNase II family 3'-5' exoribonuclease [Verrucomicrobiota bacterium]